MTLNNDSYDVVEYYAEEIIDERCLQITNAWLQVDELIEDIHTQMPAIFMNRFGTMYNVLASVNIEELASDIASDWHLYVDYFRFISNGMRTANPNSIESVQQHFANATAEADLEALLLADYNIASYIENSCQVIGE